MVTWECHHSLATDLDVHLNRSGGIYDLLTITCTARNVVRNLLHAPAPYGTVMAPRGVQLSLLIAGLAAASAAESGGLGKWNDCSEGKANNDILFSNFALRFEVTEPCALPPSRASVLKHHPTVIRVGSQDVFRSAPASSFSGVCGRRGWRSFEERSTLPRFTRFSPSCRQSFAPESRGRVLAASRVSGRGGGSWVAPDRQRPHPSSSTFFSKRPQTQDHFEQES